MFAKLLTNDTDMYVNKFIPLKSTSDMAEKLSKIDHWTILLFKRSKKLKMNFWKDKETNNGKVN